MKRMSVSMTLDAVRARRKTATRRDLNTWRDLAVGDRLVLVEKGQGLPKGAKQIPVAVVDVVAVGVEPLDAITQAECAAEGFPELTPDEFVTMWLAGHRGHHRGDLVRRIEWRYFDGGVS